MRAARGTCAGSHPPVTDCAPLQLPRRQRNRAAAAAPRRSLCRHRGPVRGLRISPVYAGSCCAVCSSSHGLLPRAVCGRRRARQAAHHRDCGRCVPAFSCRRGLRCVSSILDASLASFTRNVVPLLHSAHTTTHARCPGRADAQQLESHVASRLEGGCAPVARTPVITSSSRLRPCARPSRARASSRGTRGTS